MKKDIKQLVAEGESQQTEFKSSFNVEAMENGEVATKLATNLHQLATNLSVQVKLLIINLNKQQLTFEELKHATELATKHATISRQYFSKAYLKPAFNSDLITMLFPENQRHPKQKYYLTEKGKEVLEALKSSENRKTDEEKGEVATNLHQLAPNLPVQVKELIISLKYGQKSASELLLAPELAPKLVQAYSDKAPSYFKKKVIYPAVELGLIALLYPDKPKHPKQKYYLTEKGKEVLKALQA